MLIVINGSYFINPLHLISIKKFEESRRIAISVYTVHVIEIRVINQEPICLDFNTMAERDHYFDALKFDWETSLERLAR